MRTHIDWLSFTFTPLWKNGGETDYTQSLADGLREQVGMRLWVDLFDGEWNNHGKGRAPYTDCWRHGSLGISLYASPNLTHACVEVSGEGCESLISLGYMEQLVQAVAARVTRIDIAADIQTNVRPSEFVTEVEHHKMRASGYQLSESGETNYVGSRTSDRYARVYRYFFSAPTCELTQSGNGLSA